jgi:hypothetical protein
MLVLPEIPFADIRGGSPIDLLARFPDKAKALARATTGTFGVASRIGARVAFPYLDRASRRWLEQTNNPYRGEIDAFQSLLGISGVHALNICFEWGCTSGVFRLGDEIVLRRVLDWRFPALGEHLIVAQQSGAGGDFYNITWPAMSGTYHAVAPGRFAAAINQAPMRRHGRPMALDWTTNRIAVKRGGGLPAAHLLRQVFETAPDYASAKEMLCKMPIAVPAIFILAGLDDGCVIERIESDFAVRELQGDRVCATNHFETRLLETAHHWHPRSHDSPERFSCACALKTDEVERAFSWFKPPIANPTSRVVLNACPGSGAFDLMGVEGTRPVTVPFTHSASAL